MPNQPQRLELATRIHGQMLREIGQGIDVQKMLAHDRYARDVLLVCDALRGTELSVLAAEFRAACLAQAAADTRAAEPPGHVQQPTDWSHDTSGFGVTHPPSMPGLPSSPAAAAPAVERPAPRPAAPRSRADGAGLRRWLPWRR